MVSGKKRPGPGGPKNIRAVKALVELSSIGIFMVVATFLGGGIGYWLDSVFGTFPWLSIPFLLLGIAAGFLKLFETARLLGQGETNEEDEPSDGTDT